MPDDDVQLHLFETRELRDLARSAVSGDEVAASDMRHWVVTQGRDVSLFEAIGQLVELLETAQAPDLPTLLRPLATEQFDIHALHEMAVRAGHGDRAADEVSERLDPQTVLTIVGVLASLQSRAAAAAGAVLGSDPELAARLLHAAPDLPGERA